MNEIIEEKTMNLFQELIYEKLGIHFSENKKYILKTKLNRILMNTQVENLDDFYFSLKYGNNDSLELLVRYMTTNHTYFFREKEHFEILKDLIKIKNKKMNMIWCAASSTGEEVYSIIISLLENGIHNFKIIASDINMEVLRHLHKGSYHSEKLQHMDSYLRQKYFEKSDDGLFKINKDLKNYFVIKKINLVENIVFENKLDFIFCRNVMIYFDYDTRKKVLNNLMKNMQEDGTLFIGHSENIFNLTDKMESVFVSVYHKK